MRIGLLSADIVNPRYDALDYFIRLGTEQLLSNHELNHFPLLQRPTESTKNQLRKCDLIVVCGSKIEGFRNLVTSGFSCDDFKEIGRPVLPLGLKYSFTGSRSRVSLQETRLLDYWEQSTGTLSVSDPFTLDWIEKNLGTHKGILTGCPSIFAGGQPLFRPLQHLIFCPFFFDSLELPRALSTQLNQFQRRLFSALNQRESVLFLAQSLNDLRLGALPGPGTLYSPTYPGLHLKALVSSQGVLSLNPQIQWVTLSHHVPTCLLTVNSQNESLAKALGSPYIEYGPTLKPAEVVANFKSQIGSFSWKRVNDRFTSLKKSLSVHLAMHDLMSPLRISVPPYIPAGKAPSFLKKAPLLHLAVTCDSAFLPSFLGLLENLHSVSKENFEFCLLALDEETQAFGTNTGLPFPIHVTTLSELLNPKDLNLFRSLPRAYQAYYSKPAVLSYALKRSNAPTFFFDLDIFFFQCPSHLFGYLQDSPILLFPHLNDSLENLIKHGTFNTGMVGVAPGAEEFLAWWLKLCVLSAEQYPNPMLFFEQSGLNFTPAYFDNLAIYRKHDENIAHWNLQTLQTSRPDETPWEPRLPDKRLIRSFHASQPDPMGLFEIKYAWDQLCSFSLPPSPAKSRYLLYRNTLHQQKSHWPELSRFVLGHDLLKYRAHLPIPRLHSGFVDFSVTGAARHLLGASAFLYRKARWLKRGIQKLVALSKYPLQREENSWIQIQRAFLCSDRKTKINPKTQKFSYGDRNVPLQSPRSLSE